MTGSAGGAMTGGGAVAEPRQRLHPLTPLLRGGRLAVLAIAAISWQGYQNLGTQRWLFAIGAVAVMVLIGSVVSWFVTGYHVVGRELRIYDGLLWRRTRAIPLERLQAVEIVRPLLARLFGLAELKLEVVGGEKTEAPLAFLPVDDASALRKRLLLIARGGQSRRTGVAAAASGAGAGAGTGARGVEAATAYGAGQTVPSEQAAPGDAAVFDIAAARPEQVIHVVDNRDLVISQLLRPQWWFLPLAVAVPIFFFAQDSDLSFIAIASTITAIVGAIQAPVRVLLADWGFTIATAVDGLRLRRGLLETRSQTVPAGRIQVVAVEWPLLWRGHGWVRASMEVAGVSQEGRGAQAGTLLPVGTVPTAQKVLSEVLPGFHLTSVAVHPVPRRARWFAPLRRRVLGYQLTDTALVTRDGLLTRRLVIVPYGRIQSVRIRQGPLQRRLRLATVWADTAGRGLTAVAPHRDAAEALALATELAERSRAARHTPPPGPDDLASSR